MHHHMNVMLVSALAQRKESLLFYLFQNGSVDLSSSAMEISNKVKLAVILILFFSNSCFQYSCDIGSGH